MLRAPNVQNGLGTLCDVYFVRVELPSGGVITTWELGTQARVVARVFAEWPRAVLVALSPDGLRWANYRLRRGEIAQGTSWRTPTDAPREVVAGVAGTAALAR